MRAPWRVSPRSARAIVVLPLPDSPTRPRTSPAAIVSETPSTMSSPHADHLPGVDELLAHRLERDPADDAGDARDPREGDDQDDQPRLGAQQADEEEHHNDPREGEDDVERPHQDVVEEVAAVAGNE